MSDSPFVVDDQPNRRPKPEPMGRINLRMPFDGVEAREIPLSAFHAAEGFIDSAWVDTVKEPRLSDLPAPAPSIAVRFRGCA